MSIEELLKRLHSIRCYTFHGSSARRMLTELIVQLSNGQKQ
jgi:hypothetical protein